MVKVSSNEAQEVQSPTFGLSFSQDKQAKAWTLTFLRDAEKELLLFTFPLFLSILP